jgi:hypothetical protein
VGRTLVVGRRTPQKGVRVRIQRVRMRVRVKLKMWVCGQAVAAGAEVVAGAGASQRRVAGGSNVLLTRLAFYVMQQRQH